MGQGMLHRFAPVLLRVISEMLLVARFLFTESRLFDRFFVYRPLHSDIRLYAMTCR